MFQARMGSINPQLTAAIQQLANNGMLNELAKSVAPLAIMEQQGIGTVIKRLVAGTKFEAEMLPLLGINEETK